MSDATSAGDGLLRLATLLQPIQAAGEQLKRIGSLEASIETMTKEEADLTAKLESARADLAGAIVDWGDAKARAEKTTKDAEADAKIMVAQAKSDAVDIKEKAREQAQQIVDDALAATAKAELEHQAKIAAAETKLADVQREIAAAEITRDGMRGEAQQIEARITAAKETARKMLTE